MGAKSKDDIVSTPNSILFGMFLVDKKKIDLVKLEAALNIQKKEDSSTLRQSHRLLGQILRDDFHVFRDRIELQKYLVEFNDYKIQMDQIKYEARIYGKKE